MKKSRKNAFILIILLIFMVGVVVFYEKYNKRQGLESSNSTLIPLTGQEILTERKTILSENRLISLPGKTVMERFIPPEGYERVTVRNNSFEQWLRNYPLKEADAKVHYFNGEVKAYSVHEAVLNLDVGNRDLQQCADSIIRLRAEYFFAKKEYGKIHFNFTNGFNAEYEKWRKGYGISVSGNKTSWVKKNYANKSRESFRRYLDMVFSYSGTLSLEKELKRVDYEDLEVGDIFIRGGSPGHCLLVMDIAVNKETGKKIFIVAQGFMPAQEMHIVKNMEDSMVSPWYGLNESAEFDFAGMKFQRNQLKRFE